MISCRLNECDHADGVSKGGLAKPLVRSRQVHYIILSLSYFLSVVRFRQCVCTKCLDVLMQRYPSLTLISSQTRIIVELKLTQYVAPPF